MKYSTLKKTDDGSFYSAIRSDDDKPVLVRVDNVMMTEDTDDDSWFTYSGDEPSLLTTTETIIVEDVRADPEKWFGKKVSEKTITSSFCPAVDETGQFQTTKSGCFKIWNKDTKEVWETPLTSEDDCDVLVQIQGILFFKRNFQLVLKLHQVQCSPKTEVCHDKWVIDEYGFTE